MSEKCGKPCASLIPRWGMSWACALPKGHEPPCQPGGDCVAHGEYVSEANSNPECPKCVADGYVEVMKMAVRPECYERKEVPTETDINRKTSTESGAATSPSGRRASEGEREEAAQWLGNRGLADLSLHWPQLKPIPQKDYPAGEPQPTLQSLMADFALSQLRAAKEAGYLRCKDDCDSRKVSWGGWENLGLPCSCGFSERFGGL